MSFVLAITSYDGTNREVALPQGETTVGRDPSNALILDGRGVSRWHAKFVVKGAGVAIVDLGSTYGTRVNDVPTLRQDLRSGDKLVIGMHQLELRSVGDQTDEHVAVDVSTDAQPQPYFSDDVTLDPHDRQTLQLDESTIQFILDSPEESARLQVLAEEKSDLLRAVQELESSGASSISELTRSPSAEWQDPAYQALVLMYRVSAQLAQATDLDSFIAPVADMVIDAVNANTVLVLLLNREAELVPRVIRHRGALNPGEVPVSRAILDLVLQEQEVVISSDLGQDDRIEPGHSLALYNIRSVVAAPLKLHGKLRGVLYLHRCGPLAFSKPDSDLVCALSALLASGIEQAELKSKVVDEKMRRKALERYHPPEIAERLCAGDQISALQEHPATVVVFDIEGFSQLTQKVEPRELARILHEYYEILYEKIFANGGSLVKLHDGWALALFGAPAATNREAVWAVEAALSLCTEFSSLALLWPQVGKLALRCAVDTGLVVAGFVGPVDRLEYAAIGAPVGTASALAAAAEGTTLLITEQTWGVLPQKHYRVQHVELFPGQRAYRVART